MIHQSSSFWVRQVFIPAWAVFLGVGCEKPPTERIAEPLAPEAVDSLSKGAKVIRLENHVKWSHKPPEIAALCRVARNDFSEKIDQIESAPAGFKETILALENALTTAFETIDPLEFYAYVSQDKDIRDAGRDCSDETRNLFTAVFKRPVLQAKVKEVVDSGVKLSAIDARLLDEMTESFEDNGMGLPDDRRQKLLDIDKKLIELSSDFAKELGEWHETLDFSKEQLAGLPEELLASLEKSDKVGKDYVLTLKYPHVMPALKQVVNPQVREAVERAFHRRGGEANVERLNEAILLRQQRAKLLGYKSHAEYKLRRRMAGSPKGVRKFLDQVRTAVKARADRDLVRMLTQKQSDLGDPQAKLDPWDLRYYSNQVKIREYEIDETEIRKYFPLDHVLAGMFRIYEQLLNVRFVEIENPEVWAPGVQAYAIHDQSSEDQNPIAWFYMDLFPRDGKYNHAAAFTLHPGFARKSGYRQPVSAIVCNFSPATAEQPSLLYHREVETLFHEFGHIMHQTLTKAPYASLSGTSVKRDFVEAPSQMLENWVWQPDMLASLSSHFQTKEPLPQDLVTKMIRLKKYNIGYFYLRQLMLAELDFSYHSITEPVRVDSTKVYHKLYSDLIGMPATSDTYFQAGFGHLMGGYDAGYYGYMWSQAYSEDMFKAFQADLLSPEIGGRYRRSILEQGGSRDPNELLKEFLGREPSLAPFFAFLQDE